MTNRRMAGWLLLALCLGGAAGVAVTVPGVAGGAGVRPAVVDLPMRADGGTGHGATADPPTPIEQIGEPTEPVGE